MPFYKITITLKPKIHPGLAQTFHAIRQYDNHDIDKIWHTLEIKSRKKWGDKLRSFDCVMISKRSSDYTKYVKQQSASAGNKDLSHFNG